MSDNSSCDTDDVSDYGDEISPEIVVNENFYLDFILIV